MSKKQRQTGPSTLSQLQNLVKRDRDGYRHEFLLQLRHYQSALDIFRLQPATQSPEFGQLVGFLAAVAPCYPQQLQGFPAELIGLLEQHADVLHAELRQVLCRALILLRNRDLLPASTLLELFFKLFRCKDKPLRQLLYSHIVADIRSLNATHKNNTLNKTLQNFMYTMLQDPNPVAAKKSLDVMIELYIRGVWVDDKTVNVVAGASLSDNPKIAHTAMRFFLRTNAELKADVAEAEESDTEEQLQKTRDTMMHAMGHNKKTGKRKAKLQRVVKAAQRAERRHNGKLPQFHFVAIQHVHDPQTLAEKLLNRLRASKSESFQAKLLTMNFVSRLIGVHELIVLNYYPYCQRYLQPRQPDVTLVLTYLAQATHQLVPPDALESVIKTISNNFVSDRSSHEVMAVGLNSLREICARCPLAMDTDLLHDLIQYKAHRDKSVVMAARSLIQLYRDVQPSMLPRKERGRPNEAMGAEEEGPPLAFGAAKIYNTVPGTELLTMYNEAKEAGELPESDPEGWETASESSGDEDDESAWVTVQHDDEAEKAGAAGATASNGHPKCKRVKVAPATAEPAIKDTLTANERIQRASQLAATRLLTQEDFEKIAELKARRLLAPAVSLSRTARELEEVVDRKKLLPAASKYHQTKEERVAQIMEGRVDRGKYNIRKGKMSEFASTSNQDKAKRKNPMMLKYAAAARLKRRMSFKQRQTQAYKSKERDRKGRL